MHEKREKIIHEVFSNVSSHKLAAEIIRRHSSNYKDIRSVALDPLDLSECNRIMDLGCGFGFFTEALQGRVNPKTVVLGIDLIPEYESPFLETCRRSGLNGSFLSEEQSPIQKFIPGSFDLILCSYALYFFPEFIPEIAKILVENGWFITITHSRNSLVELIDTIKKILRDMDMHFSDSLPIESIIDSFSNENGEALLAPWFRKINRIDYHNVLIFEPGDLSSLNEYFRFKSALFLSNSSFSKNELAERLITNIHFGFSESKSFKISKDDTIFICSEPVRKK